MNIRKRKKLKAKRTPWSNTRSGRMAHTMAKCMRAMVCTHAISNLTAVNSLMAAGKLDKMRKAQLLAETAILAYKGVASVPVYGSKKV